jgi:hypothetical protein
MASYCTGRNTEDFCPQKKMQRCDILSYPHGSLLLETQADLMDFLNGVVEHYELCNPMREPSGSMQLSNVAVNYPDWAIYVQQPFELPFNVDVFVAEDEAKRCNTDETKFIQQR